MKIDVSQYGSRRRYLVPRILNEAGMLNTLYTDSNSTSTLGQFAKIATKIFPKSHMLTRLAQRNPYIAKKHIVSNDILQLKIILKKMLGASQKEIMPLIFEGSSRYFINKHKIKADWLYAMFIENYDFTKYCKQCGTKILIDVYENPYIFRELISELEQPELSCISYTISDHLVQAELRERYLDDVLALADKILVPSNYVKYCLKRSASYEEAKVSVIPYAASVKNTSYSNQSIRGRCIWIGNDPVRKGLIYANRAVTDLRKKYNDIEFRIIGNVQQELKESPFFKNAKFLGHLSKTQLIQEYKKADVFIFPTLAEGFAGVLLEAASFGVPIITTPGSGFEPDFPGVMVPFKDSLSIQTALERFYVDREFRNKMSYDLFNYSQQQTPEKFGMELIQLLD